MTDFRSLFEPDIANHFISILGVLAGIFTVIALLMGNVGSSLPSSATSAVSSESIALIKPGVSKQISQGDDVYIKMGDQFSVCSLSYVSEKSRTGYIPAYCARAAGVPSHGAEVYIKPRGEDALYQLATFDGFSSKYHEPQANTDSKSFTDFLNGNIAYIAFNGDADINSNTNHLSPGPIAMKNPDDSARACTLLVKSKQPKCGNITYAHGGSQPLLSLDDAPRDELGGPVWLEETHMFLGWASMYGEFRDSSSNQHEQHHKGYWITQLHTAYDRGQPIS